MRVRLMVAAVCGLLLAGTAVQAQGFPGGMGGRFPGGGRGRMGGGRGAYGRYRPPVDIPDLGNPVRRYIMQNKDELKLSDAQATRIDSVAKALDARNDTLVGAVRRAMGWERDSAGAAPREGGDSAQDLPPTERGGERPDDIRLRDRLNAVKPQIKEIRSNDDAAWKAATALLQKDQRKQADKYKSDAEKAHDRARSRWRGPGEGEPGGMGPDF